MKPKKETAPAICIIKDAKDGSWGTWPWNVHDKEARTLEAVVANAKVRLELAELYYVWLGSANGEPQLTIGSKKPAPYDRDDIIGECIASGAPVDMWDIFETHARML